MGVEGRPMVQKLGYHRDPGPKSPIYIKYMAVSHFKGHPQVDKPSETNKKHPKHNCFPLVFERDA